MTYEPLAAHWDYEKEHMIFGYGVIEGYYSREEMLKFANWLRDVLHDDS